MTREIEVRLFFLMRNKSDTEAAVYIISSYGFESSSEHDQRTIEVYNVPKSQSQDVFKSMLLELSNSKLTIDSARITTC